jgi:hypothetical protein
VNILKKSLPHFKAMILLKSFCEQSISFTQRYLSKKNVLFSPSRFPFCKNVKVETIASMGYMSWAGKAIT